MVWNLAEIKGKTLSTKNRPPLVLTVHGIRTFGEWQLRLEQLLVAEQSDNQIKVQHYRYGYFSAIAFLVPFARWIQVRRLKIALENLLANGEWHRMIIVAHSFGTYLVAKALLKLDREKIPADVSVIFAGSVLPNRFDPKCLEKVGVTFLLNECGNKDIPLLVSQFFVLGTGMAGRVGLRGLENEQFRNRFFNWGHSNYFVRDGISDNSFMLDHWVPLILHQKIPKLVDNRKANSIDAIVTLLAERLGILKTPFYLLLLATILVFIYRANDSRDQLRSMALAEAATLLATNALAYERTAYLAAASFSIRQNADAYRLLKDNYCLQSELLGEWHSPRHRRLLGAILSRTGTHLAVLSRESQSRTTKVNVYRIGSNSSVEIAELPRVKAGFALSDFNVQISDYGELLLFADASEAEVRDVASGKVLLRVTKPEDAKSNFWFRGELLGSGRALIYLEQQSVVLADLSRAEASPRTLLSYDSEKGAILGFATNEYEQFIAVLREHQWVQIVSLADGSILNEIHLANLRNTTNYAIHYLVTRPFLSIAVNSDGSLLALQTSSNDGFDGSRWQVVNAQNGTWVSVIAPNPAGFGAAEIRGNTLITQDYNGGPSRLFDIWSGNEIQRVPNSTHTIMDLNQAKLIVASVVDHSVLIKYLAKSQCDDDLTMAAGYFGTYPKRGTGPETMGFEVFYSGTLTNTQTNILDTKSGMIVELDSVNPIEDAVISRNRLSLATWTDTDNGIELCVRRFPSNSCEVKTTDFEIRGGSGWFSRNGDGFAYEDGNKLHVLKRDDALATKGTWNEIGTLDSSDLETFDSSDVLVDDNVSYLVFEYAGELSSSVIKYDIESENRTVLQTGLDIDSMAISRNGKFVAISSGNSIEIVDVDPPLFGLLERLKMRPRRKMTTTATVIEDVGVSDDGRFVAAVVRSREDHGRTLVDLWQLPSILESSSEPRIVASTPVDASSVQFHNENSVLITLSPSVLRQQYEVLRWEPLNLVKYYCDTNPYILDDVDWGSLDVSIPNLSPCDSNLGH